MESLHIAPKQDAKATTQRRTRRSSVKPPLRVEVTLESLSAESSEILNGLLQPGMLDDDAELYEEERKATMSRWQSTLASPVRPEKTAPARMPGTLFTPSTTRASLGPVSPAAVLNTLPTSNEGTETFMQIPGDFFAPPTTRKLSPEPTVLEVVPAQNDPTSMVNSISGKHLMRSMSADERHEFLNDLVKTSKAPPATVFVLPMGEIHMVQRSARSLGFHSHVVPFGNGEGWIIIGMDGQAVEDLCGKVEIGVKDEYGGKLKAAAGGAFAGAVATWTGLAFS